MWRIQPPKQPPSNVSTITTTLRRESIFDFLAAWQSSDLATFNDLSGKAQKGRGWGRLALDVGSCGDGFAWFFFFKLTFKIYIFPGEFAPFTPTKNAVLLIFSSVWWGAFGKAENFAPGGDANVTACVKAFLPPAVPSAQWAKRDRVLSSFLNLASFFGSVGCQKWMGSVGNEFVSTKNSWSKITQLQWLAGNQVPTVAAYVEKLLWCVFFWTWSVKGYRTPLKPYVRPVQK